MSCKLCRKFRKKYPLKNGKHLVHEVTLDKVNMIGSGVDFAIAPIKCAFEKEKFSTNNWNCETMNALRDLIQDYGHQERDDNRSASIGVLKIPESDRVKIQQGYLILTWYKSRGRVGRAYVVWDDLRAEILTLKTAEFIIDAYKKEKK